MVFQLVLALPIATQIPDFVRNDVGRADDSMYALMGISMIFLMASFFTIMLANPRTNPYSNSPEAKGKGNKEQ
jgi:hypothetical protein